MRASISLISILLLISGCSTEELKVTNPQKAILGKWEVVENSFGKVSYPGSYTEYEEDSISLDYVNPNDFTFSKYWMNDSLLFKITTYYVDDGRGKKDTLIVTTPYKYEFLFYDKLMLDLQQPSMVNKFIYKRVK